jgi:hypothetical protein
VTDASVPFFARLWLAILCAFRVLFNPLLAGRVRALLGAPEGASPAAVTEPTKATMAATATQPAAGASKPATAEKADEDGKRDALGLLALLQREGRLVDFLKQDVDGFSDADVGAAARVVHGGCRKALLGHFELSRIRSESEGTSITVPEGFDGRSIKLTGNVRGSAPYRGVLRHAGWRVETVRLPALVAGYDARIIAPAEVEL